MIVPLRAASSMSNRVSPGYPAVGYGFIPGFTSPALTYDYVETVVFQVQGLTGTLYTVSYNSNGFVFQYLERFCQWKFFSGYYVFFYSPKLIEP